MTESRAAEAPAAWKRATLLQRPDWHLRLSREECAELFRAAESCASLAPEAIRAEDFALPGLGRRLRGLQRSLEEGSGVTRVTGLSIADLDPPTIARVFCGLARHVGTPVSQNDAGDRLLDVRDQGYDPGDARVRGPLTNRPLSFHTDRCDVIAFLCMRAAESGGDNDVISSVSLHEELRRRHPADCELLRESFPYLRHTVDAGNESPYTLVPVFTTCAGHFAASFLRVLIDRAHADPSAPDLSAEQIAALDRLEEVAEDESLYVRFRQEPGDMLFLNNWVTFHRRSGFRDGPDPRAGRHLLRLWLSVPNSRPLDPRFRDHFGATEAGALRGGMRAARTAP